MTGGNVSSGGNGARIFLQPPATPDLDAGTAVVKVSGTTETVTINDVLTTSTGQTEDQTTSYTLDASQATPIKPGTYALSQLVTFANGTYGSANLGDLLSNTVASNLDLNQTANNIQTVIAQTMSTNAANKLTGTSGTGNPYLAANPIVAIAIAMEIMYSTMRRSQLETGLTSIKESQVALSLAQCAATLTLAGAQADAAGDIAQGAAALTSGIISGVMAAGALGGALGAGGDYDDDVTAGEKQVGEDNAAESNYEDGVADGENLSDEDSAVVKNYNDAETECNLADNAVNQAESNLTNVLESDPPPTEAQVNKATEELNEANAQKATAQKNLEAAKAEKAQFDETPAGQKMQLAQKIQADRAALADAQNDLENDAGTDPDALAQKQQNVKQAQETLDADQEKMAEQDPAYKKLTDKTAKDEAALEKLKGTDKDTYNAEKLKSKTHLKQAMGQMFSSIPTAVGDFLKANFTLESATAKARGQIVESYEQMVSQLMTALSKSYDTTGDAMKSILDALNSIMQSTAQSSGIQKA